MLSRGDGRHHARGVRHLSDQWTNVLLDCRLQPDGENGGVVGGAAGVADVRDDPVDERFGAQAGVGAKAGYEAGDAVGEVFGATLDQTVGVEDQRGAGAEMGGCLRAGVGFFGGRQGGPSAWSRASILPSLC